jgi:hypothetical protein
VFGLLRGEKPWSRGMTSESPEVGVVKNGMKAKVPGNRYGSVWREML